jgi:large subunit ribosomal protein L10
MRAEKQILTKEYVSRLNASPFFIVVGYQGLKVDQLTTLRKSLFQTGAEAHVVKNSIFQIAAKEAGVADLGGALAGQMAVVTGQKDVSAAAKALKNFAKDNDKLKIKFGYLDGKRLEEADVLTLADLPSIEVLRAKILGVINAFPPVRHRRDLTNRNSKSSVHGRELKPSVARMTTRRKKERRQLWQISQTS